MKKPFVSAAADISFYLILRTGFYLKTIFEQNEKNNQMQIRNWKSEDPFTSTDDGREIRFPLRPFIDSSAFTNYKIRFWHLWIHARTVNILCTIIVKGRGHAV